MSRLIPGTPVVWKDRTWVLLDVPSIDRVLIRDPVTGHTELASPSELKSSMPNAAGAHGLMTIGAEEWDEAWRRFEAIRPLLNREPRKRTRQEIEEVARSFGRDPATVYRWIARWAETKTVSGLVRAGRSDQGKSRLSEAIEAIIKDKIENYYLVPERPTIVELTEQIALACRKDGVKPPNIATVRRRVERLQDRLVMSKRRSSKEARETFEPLKGSFPGADVPLAVYQIDHSPIDVIFVDETYRRPIGRGYLTIVSDSCTRVLAGFCASLDPPGALATGLALAHAILPKAQWLAERGISASWPVEGRPAKVYADNAAEFRGTMLERACKEHDIVMENRPKGLPNYGGHIERLFRTFMHRAQTLPGTTFSNTQERGEYDSDGKAMMTLREFEQWFGTFVTKVYHQRPTEALAGCRRSSSMSNSFLAPIPIKGSDSQSRWATNSSCGWTSCPSWKELFRSTVSWWTTSITTQTSCDLGYMPEIRITRSSSANLSLFVTRATLASCTFSIPTRGVTTLFPTVM